MKTAEPGLLVAMPFLTVGGAEAVVSRICRGLKDAGFRIFVITTVATTKDQGDSGPWFADSCSVHRLPDLRPQQEWPAWIENFIARNDVKVVWLVGSSFFYDLLPALKKRFPRLSVLDLLFNPIGHTANNLKYARYINHVTVEYAEMKQWLVERGWPAAQVTTIPNGVDLERFRPRTRRDWRSGQTRADDQPPFTIGFFGRFSEEKGPDIFIDLAARLAGRRDLEFLMCGAGMMEPMLREKIERYGIQDRVHMPGFCSTAEYLACCDLVVVCSRLDGRPNIVLEALAMGICVVASRTGGIPELAPENAGLLLAEPGDFDGLVAKVEQVIDTPEWRRELSRRASDFAADHFSCSHAVAAYRDLFAALGDTPQAVEPPWRDRLRFLFRI